MATATFNSATVLSSGRVLELIFALKAATWAGTITTDLANNEAVEILFPSGEARYAISVISHTTTSSNRLLTTQLNLDNTIKAGQEIDGLYIAAGLFTDTSGDTTPSVVTSSITNSSQLTSSGARTRGLGRSGPRGRM